MKQCRSGSTRVKVQRSSPTFPIGLDIAQVLCNVIVSKNHMAVGKPKDEIENSI